MVDSIRVENLTKSYGPVRAVDALSFSVAAGSLFGLLGPDGAGKTTTLSMLAGLTQPTSGDAWVEGYHTVREGSQVKAVSHHMSQFFDLYPDLTVSENLHFFADMLGVAPKEQPQRMEQLLGFTHLTPFQHRQAGKLSGGMKQKLALATALISTPKVLFLDEPTNGVDPVSRREFWKVLYQLLGEGVTLFVSTTYLDEAERFNQVGLLNKGKLLALGTPAELKAKHRPGTIAPSLEDVFVDLIGAQEASHGAH